MAHPLELRTEAFELYLRGFDAKQTHAELLRRHPDIAIPSIKTIGEKWPYIPNAEGKTWSQLKYAAEAAAQNALQKDYTSAKTNLLGGLLKIRQLQEERVLRGYQNVEDTSPENLTQEVYALANVTARLDKMLDSQLAAETREKDAIDKLLEAICRVVPGFETQYQPKVLEEFRRLTAKAPDSRLQTSGAAATGTDGKGECQKPQLA